MDCDYSDGSGRPLTGQSPAPYRSIDTAMRLRTGDNSG
jgi:hypothetical protein